MKRTQKRPKKCAIFHIAPYWMSPKHTQDMIAYWLEGGLGASI